MTHLETLNRLAELQKDATKGPWQDGNEAIFTQAHDKGRVWNGTVFLGQCSENILLNLTFAEEAERAAFDARFIAQSGSTDFAALAAYVERLELENITLRNIAARNEDQKP